MDTKFSREPLTRRQLVRRIVATAVVLVAGGIAWHAVITNPRNCTDDPTVPGNCYELIDKNPRLGGLPTSVAQLKPVQKAWLEGELRRGAPIDPWAKTLEPELRRDMATSTTTSR